MENQDQRKSERFKLIGLHQKHFQINDFSKRFVKKNWMGE